jgi:hypothetical protein
MFQSTFERQQYIEEDVGARGGGTVEDAAKRLSCSPDQIRWLVQTGELDAFGVRLQDGSLDTSPRQRYTVGRSKLGQ